MNKHVTNSLDSCLIEAPDGYYPIKFIGDIGNGQDGDCFTKLKVRVVSGIIDLDSLDECCGEILRNWKRKSSKFIDGIQFYDPYFEVLFIFKIEFFGNYFEVDIGS